MDYSALGHIHKPQKVGGLDHIRYCGSPIPLGFDEAQQQKEVLLVDLDATGLAAITALAGRRGAIVALDPRTGQILASVSLPNYDANALVDPKQQDIAWGQLNGNAERQLINRVAQVLYPPGSTMTLIIGAAALENGVDPNDKIRFD